MRIERNEAHGIAVAAEIIARGGIIVVPTETFYGVAADPSKEEAVRRIFRLKGRSEANPLPLIAADRESVNRWIVEPAPAVRHLMQCFWPGSLTILLEPIRSLSPLLTGERGKLGVRIPPQSPARSLAFQCDGWITATSANLSGEPNADRIEGISPTVLEKADLILDLGSTPGGKPSTVIEMVDEHVQILREGAVSRRDIERRLSEFHVALEDRGREHRM